ncbi:histidine phosphatase family protein [Alteromonadaceae bacterium BrNp21-10]|nr:histidine phosphatase family protein [Alteromonadaceae bacterium BrNp21-10]
MSSTPTQFTLLRHGQVEGPAALYGSTDVSLSELGWQNLQQQIQTMPRPDRIISSPLLRCRQFAEHAAVHWAVPLVIEDDLRECDFGELDGVAFDAIHHEGDPGSWRLLEAFWASPLDCTLPGAESLTDFHQRVSACWQRLLLSYRGQQNLLICHGGVIRQILAQILPVDWRSGQWYSQLNIGYASLTDIVIAADEQAKPMVNCIARPLPWQEQLV